MKKTIGREVLFLRADNVTPRNGEGTFIRLGGGDIMFAYSRFEGETWFDNCSADIAAIFSSDEGETWSEPKIIFAHDNEARNLMCPSIFRMKDGNIGIVFLRKSKNGISAVPYFSASTDEGNTFSQPQRIIDDDNNYFVFENDHAVVLPNGRIILPANLHSEETDGEFRIIEHGIKCVFASDDNGKTWREIAERQDIPFANVSATGLQETCIYSQSDGTLRALSRTDLAFQFECFSSDNGETWSEPVPNRFFSSPDSPLLMKRAGNFTLAVFNPIPIYTTRSCDGTWGRTPLICAVSRNDGKSFPVIHMLEDDPDNGYCYPAVFDGDDYVLISYYHSDGSGVPLTATKIKKITYDELENWNVTYDGGFFGKKRGKKGKKICAEKHFEWNGKKIYVPAVYVCPKGIVADLCIKTEYAEMKAFMDKWAFCGYDESRLTKQEIRQLYAENPIRDNFRVTLTVNGKEIMKSHGCSISRLPEDLLIDGDENSAEVNYMTEYYNLDKDSVWTFRRISFPFRVTKNTVIKSVGLSLKASPETYYGDSFTVSQTGEKFTFTHPVSGTEHTLTVQEITEQQLDSRVGIDGFIMPTHHKLMTFTLEPDLDKQSFSVVDCEENDAPVPCNTEKAHSDNTSVSIAIIGGADGPTSVFMTTVKHQNNHSACSALRFEPAKHTEWQTVFRTKTAEDIFIELLN